MACEGGRIKFPPCTGHTSLRALNLVGTFSTSAHFLLRLSRSQDHASSQHEVTGLARADLLNEPCTKLPAHPIIRQPPSTSITNWFKLVLRRSRYWIDNVDNVSSRHLREVNPVQGATKLCLRIRIRWMSTSDVFHCTMPHSPPCHRDSEFSHGVIAR